jgi:putative DNA primase/helicase
LLDILNCLAARALQAANISAAAVFRVVEITQPTLLIDEADTFLRENDELRGVFNAGHRKGGSVLRTVGDEHEPRQFSVWAPLAIAMIGHLPDTLHDRSIECRLRRRKPNERVQSFRSSRADHLRVIARKMARWVADNAVTECRRSGYGLSAKPHR